MTLRSLDPLRDPAWTDLVRTHPAATAFHSAAWMRVIAETYGHQPEVVCFDDTAGPCALPLMPVKSWLTGRRGVCVPFSDFCGPLAGGSALSAEATASLRELARQRHWSHVTIRDGGDAPTYHAHHVPILPSRDEQLAACDPGTARSIAKARRHGVRVILDRGREAIATYYRLHLLTRQRHGVPPQPFRFFENVQRHMLAASGGFVATAFLGEHAVASAVVLRHRDTAIYKFAASDWRYRTMRGNHLVMDAILDALRVSGVRSLHLGRTDLSQDGLRRFKQSWGATEEPLAYCRISAVEQPARTIRRHSHDLGAPLIRSLPQSLNRLAGHLLYPHLD